MKIAVTTASGGLGSAIVRALQKEIGADQVVGIARNPAKVAYLGVEVRKGDYDSRADFEEALRGIDALLLVSSNGAPDQRIPQHRNVIEAAKSNGVKKLVYTSITGESAETAFSPIVRSNRQTEQDIRQSGLDWVIGRNGLYIEPDLEYIDHYVAAGEIANCGGEGRCTYTSRDELAYAYSRMLLEDKHQGHTYNLVGEPITQAQLAAFINEVYGTQLVFRSMSVEDYLYERKIELGEFMGTIIGGIYKGIREGAFDVHSDYEIAAGRPHQRALKIIRDFRTQVNQS
jgi:NAD(P)H dehydrogenase (quinone)